MEQLSGLIRRGVKKARFFQISKTGISPGPGVTRAGLNWSIIKTPALASEIRCRFGLSIDLIYRGKIWLNNLESYIFHLRARSNITSFIESGAKKRTTLRTDNAVPCVVRDLHEGFAKHQMRRRADKRNQHLRDYICPGIAPSMISGLFGN